METGIHTAVMDGDLSGGGDECGGGSIFSVVLCCSVLIVYSCKYE